MANRANVRCRWGALGKPKREGIVKSKYGTVLVTQRDVDEAASLGGNPVVELVDSQSASELGPEWQIAAFI